MTDTELERLRTARSNYVRQLEELSDPNSRKPSYSLAGRSVSWGEYHKLLVEMIRETDALLIAAGDDGPEGGYILTAAE